MVSRRMLIVGSALGAATMRAVKPAMAFDLEEVPATSAVGLALSNRCGGDQAHARLAADLRAGLAARHASPGTTTSAVCPICGCPVTVMTP